VLKVFQCEVYIKIHTANRFVKKVRKDIAEKIPGLAAIASRRGKSAEIANVNNDE
jgi:hypothetical protein